MYQGKKHEPIKSISKWYEAVFNSDNKYKEICNTNSQEQDTPTSLARKSLERLKEKR